MKSDRPKALHEIAGRPILSHLLDTVAILSPDRIHVVVGRGADLVRDAFADRDLNFVMQSEQLGTGHAVMQVLPDLVPEGKLLILLGDAPLVTAETMQRLFDADCDLGVLTVEVENPHNYGRIIRGEGDSILRIVEERDASPEERAIREINTGVMVTSAAHLPDWLKRLSTDNDQQEYLLTDIVSIASNDGMKVHAIRTDDENEAKGINNYEQLSVLEQEFQRRAASQVMADGVHLVDPRRFTLRGRLKAGHDSRIDINCIIEGDCEIGDHVSIGPNCVIRASRLGNGVTIKANSVIDEAEIGDECSIGPFARLRPGTRLAREVAIGNFVEVKKSSVGEGSKASHLAYLGDSIIGAGVNIGAGTITCNYDGVNKHTTRIEDHVFVGSNTALVAPVTIGEGSTIAAGSTITSTVEARSLGIARGKQKNIANWKGPGKD